MSRKSIPHDLVKNWKRQLKKGILELAVLSIVEDEEIHGYAMIKQLKEYNIKVTASTIYPILQRLSDKNLITSEWAEFDQGHPRKYYAITDIGRRALAELREEWRNFADLMNIFILKEKR